MASQIVVRRDSPIDIKIRGLDILLDGVHKSNLKYGDDVELQVDPGEHKLTVTNSLYSRTVDFEIKEGETLRFEAGNKKPSIWAALLIVVGAAPYRVFLDTVR